MKNALLLLAIASVALVSCRSSVTTSERLVSPDGHYAATLKVKDCGAGCSPSGIVIFHDLDNQTGKGDLKVFDGVGGWPIELHWAGPRTMVVTFCGGDRFTVRSNIYAGERADDGEIYPTINVLVVNDENVVIGGKAYCRFPERPEAKVSSER